MHHLINIDAYSKDETPSIVREFFPNNCVQVQDTGFVGRARDIGMRMVDTEFFVFVDSDVELALNWLQKTSSLMHRGVGAVEGLWFDTAEPWVEAYASAMRTLASLLGKKTSIEKVARAFTGDVLVRTEAIKGLTVPNVSYYEDEFIRQYIVRGGHQWLRVTEPICLHHTTYKVNAARAVAIEGYRLGFLTRKQVMRNFVTSIPKTLFAAAITGKFEIVTKLLKANFLSLAVLTS